MLDCVSLVPTPPRGTILTLVWGAPRGVPCHGRQVAACRARVACVHRGTPAVCTLDHTSYDGNMWYVCVPRIMVAYYKSQKAYASMPCAPPYVPPMPTGFTRFFGYSFVGALGSVQWGTCAAPPACPAAVAHEWVRGCTGTSSTSGELCIANQY